MLGQDCVLLCVLLCWGRTVSSCSGAGLCPPVCPPVLGQDCVLLCWGRTVTSCVSSCAGAGLLCPPVNVFVVTGNSRSRQRLSTNRYTNKIEKEARRARARLQKEITHQEKGNIANDQNTESANELERSLKNAEATGQKQNEITQNFIGQEAKVLALLKDRLFATIQDLKKGGLAVVKATATNGTALENATNGTALENVRAQVGGF